MYMLEADGGRRTANESPGLLRRQGGQNGLARPPSPISATAPEIARAKIPAAGNGNERTQSRTINIQHVVLHACNLW